MRYITQIFEMAEEKDGDNMSDRMKENVPALNPIFTVRNRNRFALCE